jgi:hypothetical protein
VSATATRGDAAWRTPTATPGFDPGDYLKAALTRTAFAPQAALSADLTGVVHHDGVLVDALLTTDHTHLLVQQNDGKIAVYKLRTAPDGVNRFPALVLEHGTSTDGMALGANDTRLATWQNAGKGIPQMTVRIWDLTDGKQIQEIELRDDTRFYAENGARWNKTGTELAVWTRAGVIEVWDTRTNTRRFEINSPGLVWGTAWNPAETRLLAWTTNTGVRLYDAATGQHLATLGQRGATLNATWSADGQHILSAGTDGLAALWDGQTGAPLDLFHHGQYRAGYPDPHIEVWSLAWSQQAGRVFTGTISGQIRAWQHTAVSGVTGSVQEKPAAFLDAGSLVIEMEANADGSRVFFRTQALQAALWDGWSRAPFFVSGKPGRPNSGMSLLAVWDAYGVIVYSTDDGAPLAQLDHPVKEGAVRMAIWLADDLLLSSTEGGYGRLWRLAYQKAPTRTRVPSATPTSPQSRVRYAPLAAGPRSASYPLKAGMVVGQTFVALEKTIDGVEVGLIGGSFGGTAQLAVKTLDGKILATQERFVPPDTGEMSAITFNPPIAVTPGQTYRLEVTGIRTEPVTIELTNDAYAHGYAYAIEPVWGVMVTTYQVLYDMRFKVDQAPLAELQARETHAAVWQTIIPPTKTAVYATGTAARQQEDTILTATAAALATRSTLLGVPPEVAVGLRIGENGSLVSSFEMQPGQKLQFIVGVERCCYVFDRVEVKARWSVAPVSGSPDGASIDPETGLFRVAENAPPNAAYTVRAILPDGSPLTTTIHIYTPRSNPFVGQWEEDAQIACSSGSFVAPLDPLRELIFRANGTMSVTWSPFEVYFDYGGTYRFDTTSGQFSFQARQINYLPAKLDTEGAYLLDSQGRLILKDVWMGVPQYASNAPVNCGHRFVRRGTASR